MTLKLSRMPFINSTSSAIPRRGPNWRHNLCGRLTNKRILTRLAVPSWEERGPLSRTEGLDIIALGRKQIAFSWTTLSCCGEIINFASLRNSFTESSLPIQKSFFPSPSLRSHEGKIFSFSRTLTHNKKTQTVRQAEWKHLPATLKHKKGQLAYLEKASYYHQSGH